MLFVEALKTLVNSAKEPKAAIQNKRMYILQQSTKVLNWLSNFEPQNVNSNDLKLPSDLKKMSGYTKIVLNDLKEKDKSKPDLKFRNLNVKKNTEGDFIDFRSRTQFDAPFYSSKNISEYMRSDNSQMQGMAPS